MLQVRASVPRIEVGGAWLPRAAHRRQQQAEGQRVRHRRPKHDLARRDREQDLVRLAATRGLRRHGLRQEGGGASAPPADAPAAPRAADARRAARRASAQERAAALIPVAPDGGAERYIVPAEESARRPKVRPRRAR